MHILYVSFETDEDPRTFDEWFLPLVRACRNAPGCYAYDYLIDPECPTRRWIVEIWEDDEVYGEHVVHPSHVEMLGLGTLAHRMHDLQISHWPHAGVPERSFRPRTDTQVDGRQALLDPIRRLQEDYLRSQS